MQPSSAWTAPNRLRMSRTSSIELQPRHACVATHALLSRPPGALPSVKPLITTAALGGALGDRRRTLFALAFPEGRVDDGAATMSRLIRKRPKSQPAAAPSAPYVPCFAMVGASTYAVTQVEHLVPNAKTIAPGISAVHGASRWGRRIEINSQRAANGRQRRG